ncbi:DegT/DnrJ/EryC1/StrS family aminotransferase [Egbenema bharatensis]|uniref:DegT/DnrJ/EryC1/StrS family aminotransferase n=1 Tax=Egbenema bharatensis TaxID=3463334 RepID=UPI003A876406
MAAASFFRRWTAENDRILQAKSGELFMIATPKKAILQTNPKASYLAYKSEIDAAIQRVLDSGFYILGEEVAAFEQEFADFIGVPYGVSVANGTDALEIALRACNVGAGDVVLTVSHTAVATVAAIELVGAKPICIDIDPVTFTIDIDHLEAEIQYLQQSSELGTLKAIIPVHLYGYPANMPAIMELAQRYGLYVIEDCAQAHGAMLDHRKIGTWGDIAAFSLYPTKNLGAIGDAGIVVTQREDLADRLKSLRQYGWRERYISDIPGMNSRLDVLQAAILRVKLKYLNRDNQSRQTIAQTYTTQLAHLPVQLPQVAENVSHVYHQYVIQVEQRDNLFNFLKQQGVGVAIHYPLPVHLQRAYQGRVSPHTGDLKTTEQLCQKILSLPMHPFLTTEEVQTTIAELSKWFKD